MDLKKLEILDLCPDIIHKITYVKNIGDEIIHYTNVEKSFVETLLDQPLIMIQFDDKEIGFMDLPSYFVTLINFKFDNYILDKEITFCNCYFDNLIIKTIEDYKEISLIDCKINNLWLTNESERIYFRHYIKNCEIDNLRMMGEWKNEYNLEILNCKIRNFMKELKIDKKVNFENCRIKYLFTNSNLLIEETISLPDSIVKFIN